MPKTFSQLIVLIALSIFWRWPLKLLDNAILGWGDEQIAKLFNIPNPTLNEVLNVAWQYGVPLIGAVFTLWCYHIWSVAHSRQLLKPHPGATKEQNDRFQQIAEALYPKPNRFKAWLRKMFPPNMMPMSEAIRHLQDRIYETELGIFVRRNFDDANKQSCCLARYVAGTNVPIFAKRPGGANLINIEKALFKNGSFHSFGDTFAPHGTKGTPTVTDISIYRRDLGKAIEEVVALGVADSDVEREFDNAFNMATFELNNSSRDAALLRLTQLRSKGIVLRNDAALLMFTAHLDDWSAKVLEWMKEVITTIKPVSEADSEWFATLGEVPAARVPIPNVRLGGKSDRELFVSIFCQHDYRLARLDALLKKNGIGA